MMVAMCVRLHLFQSLLGLSPRLRTTLSRLGLDEPVPTMCHGYGLATRIIRRYSVTGQVRAVTVVGVVLRSWSSFLDRAHT
jgi:hypothetical protein